MAEPSYGAMDEGDSMMGSPSLSSDEGELDDFGMAITEAFPDNDWTPDRLAAMKEAIRLCYEEDKAPESGKGGGDKGKGGLALIFGAPEKKK